MAGITITRLDELAKSDRLSFACARLQGNRRRLVVPGVARRDMLAWAKPEGVVRESAGR